MPRQGGFYQSLEWMKLRSKVRRKWMDRGLPCPICGKAIDWKQKGSSIADHVLPVRQHPHLALTEENIRMLHHECHTRHSTSKSMQFNEVDSDGLPDGWR